MEMPATRLRHRKGAAYYLILLLAGTSLCLGLCSGVLLLRIRSNATASPPQPYVATAGDLDAEKLAQRRKLDTLRREAEPRREFPPAAAIAPIGDPRPGKPPDEKLEAPDALPSQKRPKPSMRRAKPPPALNPPPNENKSTIVKGPSSSELDSELGDIRSQVGGLAKQAAIMADANKLLFNYLADEIGAIHVETRKIGSRIAVAEYAIKQSQELSLVYWLNVLGTVVVALQGLVALYEFSRDKWRVRASGPPS